jgi:3-hydroxyisobutyrate dehydrogenase
MSKIGFVGVGRMGANMARHLQVDCGHEITAVYDINQTVSGELADELNAKHCLKLAEVTANADVIFTVVTNDAAMREIFLEGDDHLFVGATEKTFINCATLSPKIHREVYEEGKKQGAEVLEGAMASSISQAREGTLFLMIGGDEEVFAKHRDLLGELSINLRLCGPIGRAAEVKALVNMVMNMNTVALAEGLGLADALGLDLKMVCEVFAQTGANSRVLETDSEDMIARDHDCWFSSEHAAKDSGIAASIAAEHGLNLPLNEAAKNQYEKMIQLGLGGLDKSGIAELTFKGRGDS